MNDMRRTSARDYPWVMGCLKRVCDRPIFDEGITKQYTDVDAARVRSIDDSAANKLGEILNAV